MTARPRVAEAEVCDDVSCQTGLTLVRADQVEFVTTEQVREVGYHKLDSVKMPSDLRLPKDHVLIHDTTGAIYSQCDLYVVRWHNRIMNGSSYAPNEREAMADARRYFGSSRPQRGSVEVPDGPWKQFARVQFIRYRRAGNSAGLFEHEYDPPITLYACKSPLAWRVALPTGCVVDERGFVWP